MVERYNSRHWFKCQDCGERMMLARVATRRRTRPLCKHCGSPALEPSKRGSEFVRNDNEVSRSLSKDMVDRDRGLRRG